MSSKRMSVRIDADVSGFNKSVNDMQKSMNNATNGISKSLDGASKDLQSVTKTLDSVSGAAVKVGGELTKKVTAPLVALGTASIFMAADFESAMSEVQALSGATGSDLQMLEDLARQMGAETVFSAQEAAEGLQYMSLAGWDANQMAAGLEPILKLAGAAGMELGTASDIVTDTLSMYGLAAEDAAHLTDVLAHAQANSNTNVEQLGEAFVNVGANAHAMGYSVESTAAILGVFADQGLKGGKAGTTLSAVYRDLKKAADDGTIAIGDSTIAVIDADGNYREYADIIEDVEEATKDMSVAERDAALSAIFGDQAIRGVNMSLEAGSDKLRAFEDDLINSDGAAAKMYDTMNDNLKGSLEELKSALAEAAIQLGEALTPSIQKAVDWLQNLVDWFNNLDSSTKETIVQVGLVVAAIGPMVLIFGKIVGVVSTAITAFTTVSGAIAVVTTGAAAATPAIGALATVFTVLTGPIGAAILAIGAVVGAGALLVSHLSEEAIPEVNLFGDEVSDTTAEVVGDFMEMTDESVQYMKGLAWGQQEITQEMVDDMGEKQAEITDVLMTSIEERHAEERALTEAEFEKTTALTAEQKERILEDLDEHYESEKVATQEGHDRINEIMQTAADEGRELKKHEALEIEKITNDMNETAIETMSQSAVEQQAIKEQLVNSSTQLSAREAAEVVKKASEKKQGVIDEANQQYDETVEWAIRQRDEHGTLTAQEAAEVIADAERMRDGAVSEAEDMHSEVVSEAQAQAGEHVNEVDWTTGEVLSKWDVLKNDTSTKFSEIGTSIRTNMGEAKDNAISAASDAWSGVTGWWDGLKTDTSTKFGEIATTARTKFDEAKENMLAPIRSARESISGIVDEIKGFFSNMSLKIPKPKFPSISVTQKTGVLGIPYPSFSFGGWKATGAIATGPTIVGIGEAGDEAILPLSNKSKMAPFAHAVANLMPQNNDSGGSSGGGDTIITGNTFHVREEADIKRIAQELKRLDDREARSRGRRGLGLA